MRGPGDSVPGIPSSDGAKSKAAPEHEDLTSLRIEQLRRSAEARLATRQVAPTQDELDHELRVQQAELEIQNQELREAEVSLQNSRREFFSLYDLAPVGYLTLDQSGVIQRANLTAAEMLGTDRFRLAGHPLSSYLAPRQSPRLFTHIGDVLLDKKTAVCELEFARKGESSFHAQVTSSPAPASLDAKSQVFLTIVDISDRVEADGLVRDRESRLRAIVDHAPLGIALLDKEDRIRECNEVFESLVALRSAEIVGRPLVEFIGIKDRSRLQRILRENRRSADPEMRIGPSEIEVRAWTTPLDGESHTGPGRLVLFEDVSETTRAVERAAFLERELVSVHQEKLQALGQLAGGVAHDFNNMLAAIMAFAECSLLADDLPESVQEDLAGIREASLRARSLVREVLTFARRRQPVRGPVRLRALLDSALALVKGAAPSRIRLSCHCPSSAVISADEGQVQQVIVNLLTNAVQAIGMDAGSIQVEVDAAELASATQSDGTQVASGSYWRISIKDDGPGIAEHVLDRIFEPFFTTRQQSGGCGMGLATGQAVAELHGGLLEVSSEIDFGSTFRLILPAIEATRTAELPPASERPKYEGLVLLVDDEDLVRRASRRLLMGLGANVELCSDPTEAIQRVKEAPTRFDAVITDFTMPQMTGTQLAAVLNEIAPDLPVLLLTGNRERIHPAMIVGIQLAGIVEKPLSRREIGEVLDRLPHRTKGL